MGTIYEVTRLTDGRKLALKLPREIHGASLARLAREAQIASTLSHPHIVAVVDVDVASGGFLFLVMELVEGTSLSGHRHRFGDVRWALHVLAQIADGLAALHRVGIVHRDLKPANVLVTSDADPTPAIKISDFGISLQADSEDDVLDRERPVDEEATGELTQPRLQGRTEEPTRVLPHQRARVRGAKASGKRQRIATSSFLTRTGQLPGTPSYMAPELIEGRKALSPAADMFSFGVIAHELLTGRRPFAEAPVLALAERRAVPVPSLLGEGMRGCPAELAKALDACLALDREKRPSASELATALEESLAAGPETPPADPI
jgi:serine/threonine-protein kinase